MLVVQWVEAMLAVAGTITRHTCLVKNTLLVTRVLAVFWALPTNLLMFSCNVLCFFNNYGLFIEKGNWNNKFLVQKHAMIFCKWQNFKLQFLQCQLLIPRSAVGTCSLAFVRSCIRLRSPNLFIGIFYCWHKVGAS